MIRFAVRNTSDHLFGSEGIYWHLFIEKDAFIDVKISELSTLQYQHTRDLTGRDFEHLSGLLAAPVFPKRYVEIAKVKVRAPRNRQTDLRYFLSTPHGLFPKRMKYNERGDPDLTMVGKVVTIGEEKMVVPIENDNGPRVALILRW